MTEKVCYLHKTVCFDKEIRRMELKNTWWMYILVMSLTIAVSYLFFSFYYAYMDQPMGFFRLLSTSYISGVIGFWAVVFNNRALRAIFISLSPLIVILVPLVYILTLIYPEGANNTNNNLLPNLLMTFLTHTPHLIFLILLLIQKEETQPDDMLLGSLFWGLQLTVTYAVYPSFGTFYYLSYLPTLLIVESCIFVSWLILHLRYKKRQKILGKNTANISLSIY